MLPIRVSLLAELDLDAIWSHVAERSGSLKIAGDVVDSITRVFTLLATNPQAGRLRNDIDPDVRSFPIGNYLVYYRLLPNSIVVSRVLHAKRDQTSAFSSES